VCVRERERERERGRYMNAEFQWWNFRFFFEAHT
jgi:hypothetical protein